MPLTYFDYKPISQGSQKSSCSFSLRKLCWFKSAAELHPQQLPQFGGNGDELLQLLEQERLHRAERVCRQGCHPQLLPATGLCSPHSLPCEKAPALKMSWWLFCTESALSGLCPLWEFSPPFFLNKLAAYGHFHCLHGAVMGAKGSWKCCCYHNCVLFLFSAAFHSSQSIRRGINRRKRSYILMWAQCALWPWLVYQRASVSCWLGGMIFNILFYKLVVYSNFVFLLRLMITAESTRESSASSLWRPHLNIFATVRNGLRLCYSTQKRRGKTQWKKENLFLFLFVLILDCKWLSEYRSDTWLCSE